MIVAIANGELRKVKKGVRMNAKKITSLLMSISISSGVAASEVVDGMFQWNFLSDEDWPSGYNQNTGKPDDMSWNYDDYPMDFFSRINNALPEARVNESFLTDDRGANITLQEEAEVYITFLHEGAGYKNSFGYFIFDANNPPVSVDQIEEVIVFPNLSYPHMASGHRVSIGTFPAGTSIGFFLAANGFSYYTGVKQSYSPHYYSLKGLNPGSNDILRQHNVLLYDAAVSEVIIGFEDLPRSWGDNDFNDAVFSVGATPSIAIDDSNLVEIPNANDSDADGVADESDEFPNNYDRAYRTFYPSINDYVTLAFEDNWPRVGDYDMNDLVVHERFEKIYNASGQLTAMRLDGYIAARGGDFHNGFAVRLMGVAPDQIKSAYLDIDDQRFIKVPEGNQTDAVLVLWKDTHVFTLTGESGACSHFNTYKTCSEFEPVPFTLDVNFSDVDVELTHNLLDFFIFRSDYRGREIHFADYPPTDLFDFTQLGKLDDSSEANIGRYFRTSTNMPWALKIPTKWRHPREYIDVLWAYPDFEVWVESAGASSEDWYIKDDRKHHIY